MTMNDVFDWCESFMFVWFLDSLYQEAPGSGTNLDKEAKVNAVYKSYTYNKNYVTLRYDMNAA